MNVLVDYDNVRQQHSRKGLVYIVDRVLQAVASKHAVPQRARFRLYGGWYELRTLTRRAQGLIAEIASQFPRVMPIGGTSVVVDVELAYSLEIEPRKHLWHTYRRYGGRADVACNVPSSVGCAASVCALENMYTFLTTRTCPEPSCALEPENLLFKSQQKLVDTMLTADAIFLAQNDSAPIAVVTSDDDLWPALRTALLHGKTVIHLHTLPGHHTPAHYSGGVGAQYVQSEL